MSLERTSMPTRHPYPVTVSRLHGRPIATKRNAFRADQFRRFDTPKAHEQMTGPELGEQSGGTIDAFCDFVGSGGTLVGTSNFRSAQNPYIKCFPIEPEGAAVIASGDAVNPEHPIQGGGYALASLEFLCRQSCDRFLQVNGEIARQKTCDPAQYERIVAGFSAGANVAGAVRLVKGDHKGQTIAVVFCDSGLKSLSTDLFL